jgi:cysteine desulfuration protein SufE
MKSISQIQEEITDEFSLLKEDIEAIMFHMVKLGRQLPPIPETDKTDEHLIKGCQSKVWLTASLENDKIFYYAGSNTTITLGLISLLIRIFNGQSPEAILNADLHFIEKNNLDRFIGNQRSNGFAAMIRQMKLYAHEFHLSAPI